jgi:hypothetical protein
MTDRRGNNRLTIKKSFVNSSRSSIYLNKTNSRGMMITTDTAGRLVYIPSSGSVGFTSFASFDTDPAFIYEDLDSDGSFDYIFMDNTTLTVFDRFKEIMIKHEFQEKTDPVIQFHQLSESPVLSIVDRLSGKVFLFDKHGLIGWSADIEGDTQVAAGSLKNDEEINLVVGKGQSLYNYTFE